MNFYRRIFLNFYHLLTTGLPRLPIVGSYLHLLWGNYQFPHKTVRYYVDKLKSKLLTCYLGGVFCIVVSDYSTIKEVFLREDFDGRPIEVDVVKARALGKKLGTSSQLKFDIFARMC